MGDPDPKDARRSATRCLRNTEEAPIWVSLEACKEREGKKKEEERKKGKKRRKRRGKERRGKTRKEEKREEGMRLGYGT
jgi:hypothetical protein